MSAFLNMINDMRDFDDEIIEFYKKVFELSTLDRYAVFKSFEFHGILTNMIKSDEELKGYFPILIGDCFYFKLKEFTEAKALLSQHLQRSVIDLENTISILLEDNREEYLCQAMLLLKGDMRFTYHNDAEQVLKTVSDFLKSDSIALRLPAFLFLNSYFHILNHYKINNPNLLNLSQVERIVVLCNWYNVLQDAPEGYEFRTQKVRKWLEELVKSSSNIERILAESVLEFEDNSEVNED